FSARVRAGPPWLPPARAVFRKGNLTMTRTFARSRALKLRYVAVAVLGIVSLGRLCPADDDVIFTIDSGQSTLSWSGHDDTYGSIGPQFPGSLTAAVSGTFVVSFDASTDTPTAIRFVGNNANNNNGYFQLATSPGPFAPLGLPANLGGTTAGG